MRSRNAFVSLAVLAVAVLLLPLASASPGAGTNAGAPTGLGEASSYTVTLVTGDRVHLEVIPGGRQAATVDPAPRGEGIPEPAFESLEVDGDLYVIPSDAALYVDTKLDRDLFNLTKLVAQGLDDEASESLPVIVDYEHTVGVLPPAMDTEDTLESIDARAAREPKGKAAAFGRALASQAREDLRGKRARAAEASGLFAGIEKIWLDEKVEAALEDSVPQIGAPTAWQAGYDGTGVTVAVLDTGVDATHPDLSGKVATARNFTDSATETDRHGHGTHVASTIAGSGAASGGLRKGVAPEATIVSGKVLADSGSGLTSWVIAGMEWAARDQGVDVVNMSLGADPSDGNDPMSQAVDNLTQERGTLFAIAAGNAGGNRTIGAPGAASSALTVGAVDKSDVLAPFSSRGPRLGDYAIKPDVTAPGVGIAAARAAGTSMATPIDEHYTRASGTSMATPHVAGAAALLAQRHPDWEARELKTTLVTTASPGPYTIYQQGGGRVDLTRAFTQPTVLATPAPLDLGFFPWPHEGRDPVEKTVTYTNLSDVPVTLDLTLEVADERGDAPAAGMLDVSPRSVTLTPGESGAVEVVLDTTVGDPGLYGGYLVARDESAGAVLRTPLGFHKEPERVTLRIEGIARDGRPATGISTVLVMNVDDSSLFFAREYYQFGIPTFRVPPGTYSVMGYIYTYDEPQWFEWEAVTVANPEFDVTEDTTIVLDARQSSPYVVETQHDAEPRAVTLAYFRKSEHGPGGLAWRLHAPSRWDFFAAPTDPVTKGQFEHYSRWQLIDPPIRLRALEPEATPIDADYIDGSPRLDGRIQAPLVYAGLGRPQDFAGLDVQGKIALIRRGEITFTDKARNAADAGAVLAVIFNNVPGKFLSFVSPDLPIPALALSLEEGERVLGLLDRGQVVAEAVGVAVSPFLYDLVFPEPGRIPEQLQYEVGPKDVATLPTGYHGHVVPGHALSESRHTWRPYDLISVGFVRDVPTPLARTEYVTANDNLWRQHVYFVPEFTSIMLEPLTYYQGGQRTERSWWKQPALPSVVESAGLGTGLPVLRDQDVLVVQLAEWGDADPGHWGWKVPGIDTTPFRLFRDGQLVAQAGQPLGSFPLSAEPATYRMELDVRRSAPWWRLSTRTATAWTFPSQRPPGGGQEILPLLLVDYDLHLDLLNRAPLPQEGGGANVLDFAVRHQLGAAGGEPIGGLRLWVSYDDGTTWKQKQVRSRGGGRFQAVLDQRDVEETSGFVSLKVEAWDRGGSRIEQETIRAYALKPRDG